MPTSVVSSVVCGGARSAIGRVFETVNNLLSALGGES